jgi:pyruvate/2-oxoglutarate dehydrogenase complex dihydrolipoamide acyltransferase (E2) component
VTGILEKRFYNEGEPVKAGQALFRIERAPFEIALAQATARLAEAQALDAQTARELQRLRGLVAERAISQKEFDDTTVGQCGLGGGRQIGSGGRAAGRTGSVLHQRDGAGVPACRVGRTAPKGRW